MISMGFVGIYEFNNQLLGGWKIEIKEKSLPETMCDSIFLSFPANYHRTMRINRYKSMVCEKLRYLFRR
jgi:hypothetical protein